MKRIILSLLSASLLLSSSYEDGVKAYKEKDYKKAIKLFKSSKKEYSNVKMQLLWAKSELALGRKEYATAAYERVMALQPQNLEAALTLVDLYKKDGQDDEAAEVAASFDDKDLTPEQRTSLLNLLNVSYVKMDKFTGLFSTKLGYDSNIASTPHVGDLGLFATTLGLTLAQREALGTIKGTGYSQSLASISYTHDLREKGGWFVNAGATAMTQINFKESLLNTKYAKINAGIGYKVAQTTITLPLSYDFTSYLDKDLLENYTASPVVSTIIASKYILNIGAKASMKRYIPQSMKSYDSDTYGTSASLYYIFGGSYILGKVSYDGNLAVEGGPQTPPPKYLDSSVTSASVATRYRMRYGYVASLDYKLRITQYKDKLYFKDNLGTVTWKNERREDIYQSVGVGLSKDIFNSAKLTSQYRYGENTTNYKVADYEKHNVSVGLEYSF